MIIEIDRYLKVRCELSSNLTLRKVDIPKTVVHTEEQLLFLSLVASCIMTQECYKIKDSTHNSIRQIY